MGKKPSLVIRLVHFEGPLKGEIQEFTESNILIGRDPACQVTFPKQARTIHRKHAIIAREGNRFRVINQGINGTFLNGKRVENAFLQDGDVLMFAPGGPKLSFSMEPITSLDEREAMPPEPSAGKKDVPLHPQVPRHHSHMEFSPDTEALDLSRRKARIPLIIQYGPTLRSFKELPVTAGKHPTCDFVLIHPNILDQHVLFFAINDQYHVKDLTGRNLVSINGSPVGVQASLHPGSHLALSPQGPTFRFLGGGRLAEIEGSAPSEST